MKKALMVLLVVVLFTVMVSSVSSVTCDYQAWCGLKKNYANLGYVRDYNAIDIEDVGVTNITIVGKGTDYFPLSFDFDDDGDKDIVLQHGTYLRVFNSGGTELDNTVLGFNQQTDALAYNIDDDDYIEYITVIDDNIKAYQWDGVTFTEEFSVTTDGTDGEWIGIKCHDTAYNNDKACFYLSNEGDFCRITDLNGSGSQNCLDVAGIIPFNSSTRYRHPPAIDDIDGDNDMEFVSQVELSPSCSENERGVMVWDIVAEGLKTSFSGDGIYDTFDCIGTGVSGDRCAYCYPLGGNPVIVDIDDVGNKEIIVSTGFTRHHNSGTTSYLHQSNITAIQSDGTPLWSMDVTEQLGASFEFFVDFSDFMIADLSVDDESVCLQYYFGYADSSYSSCLSSAGSIIFNQYQTELNDDYEFDGGFPIAFDFDNDGNDEFMTSEGNIINGDDGEFLSSILHDNDYNTIIDDVDGDGFIDAVSSKSTETIIRLIDYDVPDDSCEYIDLYTLECNSTTCPYSEINENGWYEWFNYNDSVLNHGWKTVSDPDSESYFNASPVIDGVNQYIVMDSFSLLKMDDGISCEDRRQIYSFFINPVYNVSLGTQFDFTLYGEAGMVMTMKLIYEGGNNRIKANDGEFLELLNYYDGQDYTVNDDAWTDVEITVFFNDGDDVTYEIRLNGQLMYDEDGESLWDAYTDSYYGAINKVYFFSYTDVKLDRINNPDDEGDVGVSNKFPVINVVLTDPEYDSDLTPHYYVNESSYFTVNVSAYDSENDTIYYSVNCDYPLDDWTVWTTNNIMQCFYTVPYDLPEVRVSVNDDEHLSGDSHAIYEELKLYIAPVSAYQNFSDINYSCFPEIEYFNYSDTVTNHGWFGDDVLPIDEVLKWGAFIEDDDPEIYKYFVCQLEDYFVSFDLAVEDIDDEFNASGLYDFKIKFENLEFYKEVTFYFREREADPIGDIYFQPGVYRDETYIGSYTEGICANYQARFNFRQKVVTFYKNSDILAQVDFGAFQPNRFDLIELQHEEAGARIYFDDLVLGDEDGSLRINDGCINTPGSELEYDYDNDILLSGNEWDKDGWSSGCSPQEFTVICFVRLFSKYIFIDRIIVPLMSPIKEFFLGNILTAVLFLIIFVSIIALLVKNKRQG